jgi:hypothetical protein
MQYSMTHKNPNITSDAFMAVRANLKFFDEESSSIL